MIIQERTAIVTGGRQRGLQFEDPFLQISIRPPDRAEAVELLVGVATDSVLGRTITSVDGRFVLRAPHASRRNWWQD